MIEQQICEENDIKEGEMKQFELGQGKVLITKTNGSISAVSAKCTHYGAPLVTGAYKHGKVRCPWHGACFNTVTGDIEDFPGLDSLHKYEVNIRNGKVFVKANEETFADFRRVKPMQTCCSDDEIYLIIGGGCAAILCAETLRQEGFKGQVIMTTQECHVPYDRTKLSKMLNAEAEKLYLRKEAFLKEKDIKIQFNKKAYSVDSTKRTVSFSDGSVQQYTKLFVATGGQPRVLSIPGHDLQNIFYLRSPEDANKIHESSQGKDVVILGTGFIGMEIAAYLTGKAKSVAVVGSGRSKVPFEKLLGEKVGSRFMKMHMDKGVKFHLDQPVKEIKGANGKVAGVVLQDDEVLPADVVLSGIGVVPSTGFMKDTSVQMNKYGHIIVDKFMKADEGIYAGGDIVSYPYCHDNDCRINIGHWQLASAHGRVAAMNMLGKEKPCVTVPFFWTGQFGKSLRYAGHCSSFDEIVYEGDVDDMKFAAYYIRKGKVHAIACMNMGAKASEVAFELQNGCFSCPEHLRVVNSSKHLSSHKVGEHNYFRYGVGIALFSVACVIIARVFYTRNL